MCRLLALAAPEPRSLADALGPRTVETYRRMSRLHRDGWGGAWLDADGQVQVYRSTTSAKDDPIFAERTAAPSRAALYHLRWASTGMDVTGLNTHPFLHDGVAVAHNGFIASAEELDELLPDDVRGLSRGTTDSERYAALIHHYRRQGRTLAASVALAAGQLRARFPHASLNLVAIDATSMVAVRASSTAIIDIAGMRDAGLTPSTAPDSHLDGGYYRLSWRRWEDGTIAISSSGLPREGWEPLPDETVTEVSLATGAVVQRSIDVASVTLASHVTAPAVESGAPGSAAGGPAAPEPTAVEPADLDRTGLALAARAS